MHVGLRDIVIRSEEHVENDHVCHAELVCLPSNVPVVVNEQVRRTQTLNRRVILELDRFAHSSHKVLVVCDARHFRSIVLASPCMIHKTQVQLASSPQRLHQSGLHWHAQCTMTESRIVQIEAVNLLLAKLRDLHYKVHLRIHIVPVATVPQRRSICIEMRAQYPLQLVNVWRGIRKVIVIVVPVIRMRARQHYPPRILSVPRRRQLLQCCSLLL